MNDACVDDGNVVLECLDLSKVYSENSECIRVLNALNLKVYQGQRIAIVGSSGSGKTTLLNIMAGLEQPTSGEVLIDKQLLCRLSRQELATLRNRRIGFVYQFHHLLTEFTALENVAIPLLMRKKFSLKSIYQRAEIVLAQVGLAACVRHKPPSLSGGERQRVAIARALVTHPQIVLMDEPTGNLDQHTAESIHDLMLDLSRQFFTSFVIVTHDLKLASKMDNIYHLAEGKFNKV